MEQLIRDIEAYAAARGVKPATVLRYAIGQGPREWRRWESGGGCSVRNAQKIRDYISTHPVEVTQ